MYQKYEIKKMFRNPIFKETINTDTASQDGINNTFFNDAEQFKKILCITGYTKVYNKKCIEYV